MSTGRFGLEAGSEATGVLAKARGELRGCGSRGDFLTPFFRRGPEPVLMLPHPVAVAPDVDDVAMVRHDVVHVAPREWVRIETVRPTVRTRRHGTGRMGRSIVL